MAQGFSKLEIIFLAVCGCVSLGEGKRVGRIFDNICIRCKQKWIDHYIVRDLL